MSLDSCHHIETLKDKPPQRLKGMVGRIERFKSNPAPSGYPLNFPVKIDKPGYKMGMRKHPIHKVIKPHR
jgi:hypothetical protein